MTRLRVLARGLPGVQTVPTADGHFVLDHVPLGVVPRLMLDGLGPTWAHEPAHATIGKLVRIDVVPGAIVRGRVLDATSGEPLGDALVWCGELGAVRTDERGRYELLRQLPGPVEIEAKWELVEGPRRRTSFTGRTAVVLEAAREHDGVDVRIPTTHPR